MRKQLGEFNLPYSVEAEDLSRLPEQGGQFIYIDDCSCHFPLTDVLEILKVNFKFEKFLLIRCLINKKSCIRIIFYSTESISEECKTYYRDESSSSQNVTSILQGPIERGFHNVAKYRFLKAFCDSYSYRMTSANFLCSICVMEVARITIRMYFSWRVHYKQEVLNEVKQRNALLALKSADEQMRFHLANQHDYVEWGTHRFDIESIHYQLRAVESFFKKMRGPKDPFSRQQSKAVYKTLPDGRKLFLGFRK